MVFRVVQLKLIILMKCDFVDNSNDYFNFKINNIIIMLIIVDAWAENW